MRYLVSGSTAMDRLGVSKGGLRRLADAGLVGRVKLGLRTYRYRGDHVDELLSARPVISRLLADTAAMAAAMEFANDPATQDQGVSV